MAGVKGRSGRKSLRDEEKRLKAIEKAWDLVTERLFSNNPNKYKLAEGIVLKDITTKLEGKGFGGNAVIIFRNPRAVQEQNSNIPAR